MPLDRRATRLLNTFCGIVAVGAVGGVGFLAWKQQQTAEALPTSPRLASQRQLRRQAQQALDRKDYAEAERIFQQAISETPRDGELHKTLGNLYLQDGKRKLAWQQFTALAPTVERAQALDASSRVWMADLEWEFGDPKKATKLCELQTDHDWIHPRPQGAALVSRAHVYITENDGDMSLPDRVNHIRRALVVNPRSVDARVGLVNVLWDSKQKDEALRELKVAQKMARPGQCTDTEYLAFILGKVGKKQESAKFAEQALRASANRDPRLTVALAHVFANLDQKQKALGLLKEAVGQIKEPDADTLCNFASVYAHCGQPAEALTTLERADKIATGGAKARVFEMRKEISAHGVD